MKKYIILSVNDNKEYLFYLPLTVWAWRKFGWEPIVFFHGNTNTPEFDLASKALIEWPIGWLQAEFHLLHAEGYKSETIAQISRLYGACVVPDDSYLMTGDIDLIPLSDYWNFDESVITQWGHDLTNYKHQPICFVGASAQNWKSLMGLTSNDYNALIKRDLDQLPQAKSTNKELWWCVDQDLITQRLENTRLTKAHIARGTDPKTGYPTGRVDRSHWTLNHDVFIDAHLPRSAYSDSKAFGQIMDLLTKIWPNEDFQWFKDYTTEFKNLVNG